MAHFAGNQILVKLFQQVSEIFRGYCACRWFKFRQRARHFANGFLKAWRKCIQIPAKKISFQEVGNAPSRINAAIFNFAELLNDVCFSAVG